MSLWTAAGAVGAILLAVLLAGLAPALALLPRGKPWRAERWGCAFLLGLAAVAAQAALALALGAPPGWSAFLIVSAAFSAGALWARPRGVGDAAGIEPEAPRRGAALRLLAVAALLGVGLYALRALTEPMWSNDFLAIWGLKAKAMFLARAFPSRLWPGEAYGFSHPEYPLGLPLVYAGLASLLERWDDHALALLFPALQVATLAILFGWLRRRTESGTVAMAAAALLAWFEPLYSGFLTGLAEVPLSAACLLFGTAYCDSLDAEQGAPADAPRPWRRLAAASLLSGFLKNEGVFLACAGGIGALAARRFRTAAAALIPAAAAAAVSRLASRGAPLRDFDFTFLGSRVGELPARIGAALGAEAGEIGLWGGAVLACLALLALAGRRTPFADRLLALAAACLAVYLLLPAFAVRGPSWLVRTALPRTTAALAPLAAAGLAGRLRPDAAAPALEEPARC